MRRRKRVLTLNHAHCMRCGKQTASRRRCECGCSARVESPPGYIPAPTTNTREETAMKRRKRTPTVNDARCVVCHEQLTELGACACHGPRPDYSGLGDDGDRTHGDQSRRARPAFGSHDDGYIPSYAANAGRMQPIPDVDWFPSGGDRPTANAEGGADGLIVNEGAKGGLPELDIDWDGLSVFPRQR